MKVRLVTPLEEAERRGNGFMTRRRWFDSIPPDHRRRAGLRRASKACRAGFDSSVACLSGVAQWKSSCLVNSRIGFDPRLRIQPGCGAVAARRVWDPEAAGSTPATLTGDGERLPSLLGVVAPMARAPGRRPGGCGFEARLRREARWSMDMTGGPQPPEPGSSPGRAATCRVRSRRPAGQ